MASSVGMVLVLGSRRPTLARMLGPRLSGLDVDSPSETVGQKLEEELLACLTVLPLLLKGGMGLLHAIAWSAARSQGDLTRVFVRIERAVDLGENAQSVLSQVASETSSASLREFAMKARVSLLRGNRLAGMLESQSDGIRGTLRARQISEAGRRENQMLLPLVFLILPVTIAFAMYPSVLSFRSLDF